MPFSRITLAAKPVGPTLPSWHRWLLSQFKWGPDAHSIWSVIRQQSPERYTSAPFPDAVNAPVQYGPRLATLAVYLTTQQLLPRRRTKEVLGDLRGAWRGGEPLKPVIKRAAHLLARVKEQIKAALSREKVIHQDKRGLYVCTRRIWMHVTATRSLTHYQVHRSRGHQAVDDNGILTHFEGTSVHDAWAAYFRYDCQQSLCCVHLLR